MSTHTDPLLHKTKVQNRVGLISSILLALITFGTFVIAVLTPPLSGPFCIVAECYKYPYLDIASRFPRDYIWMYPAMLVMLVYIIFIVSIYVNTSKEKKIFSQLAVIFSSMSSIVFLIDFFLQVSVIQPSLVNSEFDGISLLSQFNPHGIFIVLEELGYILMSISFLFIALTYSGNTKVEKATRIIFFGGFVLTLVSFIYISMVYGIQREYRFEVAVITIDWTVLIVAGILQSIIFRRNLKHINKSITQ